MRTLRLARIAAEAEALRLRRQAGRTAARIAIGMVALVFLGCALVCAHIAIWYALRDTAHWPRWLTGVVLTAGDFVLGLFMALLAARSSPGRLEVEALQIRQRAVESATSSFALTAMLVPTMRLALNLLRRNRQAR